MSSQVTWDGRPTALEADQASSNLRSPNGAISVGQSATVDRSIFHRQDSFPPFPQHSDTLHHSTFAFPPVGEDRHFAASTTPNDAQTAMQPLQDTVKELQGTIKGLQAIVKQLCELNVGWHDRFTRLEAALAADKQSRRDVPQQGGPTMHSEALTTGVLTPTRDQTCALRSGNELNGLHLDHPLRAARCNSLKDGPQQAQRPYAAQYAPLRERVQWTQYWASGEAWVDSWTTGYDEVRHMARRRGFTSRHPHQGAKIGRAW